MEPGQHSQDQEKALVAPVCPSIPFPFSLQFPPKGGTVLSLFITPECSQQSQFQITPLIPGISWIFDSQGECKYLVPHRAGFGVGGRAPSSDPRSREQKELQVGRD